MNETPARPGGRARPRIHREPTFDEIRVGDSASLQRTLDLEEIQLFAIMSGDVNTAHVDREYAASSLFHEVIAPGMWGGARRHSRHRRSARADRKDAPPPRAATRGAPARTSGRYQRLDRPREGTAADRDGGGAPLRPGSLGGALSAAKAGLIRPVLVGPGKKIEVLAAACAAAPAAQPCRDPRPRRAPAGAGAGRLLRHRVSPERAGPRAAGGAARGRRRALRLSRPVVRIPRARDRRRLAPCGKGAGDRRAPRQRLEPVRDARRAQRRLDDGLYRP